MTEDKQDEPKIIVDEDWKSQVEAEKEQLKQEADSTEPEPEMPEASFAMLVSTLGTQVLSSLGQMPDPISGQPTISKPIAKHYIDTLGMLEEKTKGNLTEDEAGMLTNMLHQLRMLFVAAPDKFPEADEAAAPEAPSIELP